MEMIGILVFEYSARFGKAVRLKDIHSW